MSKKPTTELTLTGYECIDATLEVETQTGGAPTIEIAKVGGMSVALRPGMLQRKNDALETVALITAVTNPAEQALAVENVAQLKGYLNALEKARKEVKQPFWDAGQAIDNMAKKEAAPILKEVTRVEKLLAAHHAEQERLARAAEQAAQAAERARQAEEDAKRKREEALRAEAERLQSEAEVAALSGETDKATELAQAAQANTNAADATARAIAAQAEAEQFQPALVPVPVVTKAAGASHTPTYEIEVTDVAALYAKYGTRFVRLEPDLQAIRYYLATPGTDANALPGVKATPVVRVAVRAAKQ